MFTWFSGRGVGRFGLLGFGRSSCRSGSSRWLGTIIVIVAVRVLARNVVTAHSLHIQIGEEIVLKVLGLCHGEGLTTKVCSRSCYVLVKATP